jgi:hypothetical protein
MHLSIPLFALAPFTYALALFALLLFKHFLADYPLQTPYMLFKAGLNHWFKPLCLHCGVHALLTFLVFVLFAGLKWALLATLVDFACHFLIDLWKSRASFNVPVTDRRFWWYLGFDQLLHGLTYVGLVWLTFVKPVVSG